MSEKNLVLGIDIGTSSVKVALVTSDNNPRTLAFQSRDFGSVCQPACISIHNIWQPNEHEQDVGKIFNSLHFILSRLPQSLMANVTAISVAGQMHGIIGWMGQDLAFIKESKTEKKRLETGSAIGGCGNLITWLDRRCNKQFLDSLPSPTCSEKPFAGFGCATLLWQMHHQPGEFSPVPVNGPEQTQMFQKAAVLRKISVGSRSQRSTVAGLDEYEDVRDIAMAKSRSTSQMTPPQCFSRIPIHHAPWTCAGTIADFLVAALASLPRVKMSPQMAMSWGYFDSEHNCWDLQALDASGFSLRHLLPEIVPCGTIVGKLTFNWEGIPAGADVFVAHGDLQCSVYPFLEGSTRNPSRDVDGDSGIAACNLSTSAQMAFKLPAAREKPPPSKTILENGESVFAQLLRTKRIAVWPFFKPKERIVVAASLNGGNVIDRFVKMLRVWCRQLGCPAMEISQIYDRLMPPPPSSDNQFIQHLNMQTSASRGLRVDPRLFGERYSEFEEDGCGGSSGATLSNIQPGDLVNLPDVYAAICRGIVHNLVGMVPPELLEWAGVQRLFCMGGAMKRNPILLQQLEVEFGGAGIDCISVAESADACVGAALYAVSRLSSS